MTAIHAPAARGVLAMTFGLLIACDARASERALEPYAGPAPAALTLPLTTGARAPTEPPPGEVVLLHFFATWCEPCRPELASLDGLVAEKKARGLTVLGVSVAEPASRVARFLEADPVGFPVALDESRAAARAWGVDALPSTFVIDRAGRPRLVARRDLDWRDPAVAGALEPLLAEAGGPFKNKAESGSEGGK